MSTDKRDNVEDQPLLVIVFDRTNGRYCVDSGKWLNHGFIGPKDADRDAPSKPPSSPPTSNEDVMRCLRSLLPGHTTHCHWHVWTGSAWKDTGMESCGSCS